MKLIASAIYTIVTVIAFNLALQLYKLLDSYGEEKEIKQAM